MPKIAQADIDAAKLLEQIAQLNKCKALVNELVGRGVMSAAYSDFLNNIIDERIASVAALL